LSDFLGEKEFVVPKKQIAKIIDYRIYELFDMISDEMRKLPIIIFLPAGVVLAGGGSNLEGFRRLLKIDSNFQ